jgi:hypothetical protein
MPAFRSVVSVLLRSWETFLYTLKAGPAGGRLRRPSSRRQPHDGHRGTGLTLRTRPAMADRCEGEPFMPQYADLCRPPVRHNVGSMRRLGH